MELFLCVINRESLLFLWKSVWRIISFLPQSTFTTSYTNQFERHKWKTVHILSSTILQTLPLSLVPIFFSFYFTLTNYVRTGRVQSRWRGGKFLLFLFPARKRKKDKTKWSLLNFTGNNSNVSVTDTSSCRQITGKLENHPTQPARVLDRKSWQNPMHEHGFVGA